ncbi:hypothetical protein RZS08_13945, partial [Arthrospira platensis SPKY1]|nr:hypothetical protein [Arthrospira platensis SPKY1]
MTASHAHGAVDAGTAQIHRGGRIAGADAPFVAPDQHDPLGAGGQGHDHPPVLLLERLSHDVDPRAGQHRAGRQGH